MTSTSEIILIPSPFERMEEHTGDNESSTNDHSPELLYQMKSAQPLSNAFGRSCLLLDTLPKDVLARDILGYLTDKGTKNFFEALGATRLKSPSFAEVRNQFCLKHGSKFEDSESFVTSHSDDNIIQQPNCILNKRKRCCPECYAEEHTTTRCHGCKVFYPTNNKSKKNKAFLGLKCQKCDHMAFCRACLSNEQPRTCESTIHSSLFGRKHSLSDQNRRKSSCHNYCCSSVFTNTMCGEYVCSDCCDDNQKQLRQNHSESYDNSGIEVCEDCGKSTCLDPHCLVCADFKLIHMVCKFSPEDAYRMDIGGLLFGSKRNGSNLNKLRRTVSDCMVWIFVGLMLSKMWLKLA